MIKLCVGERRKGRRCGKGKSERKESLIKNIGERERCKRKVYFFVSLWKGWIRVEVIEELKNGCVRYS